MRHNILFEGISCDWCITFIETLDVAVGIKFVFSFELTKGLNIFIKGLDRFFETCFDGIISIPEPDVFIREEFFVSRVFWLAFRFFSWSQRSFEHLLAMSFEEMSE
jgi:hypothetical protein